MTLTINQITTDKYHIDVTSCIVDYSPLTVYRVELSENCGCEVWRRRKQLTYTNKSSALATFRRWKREYGIN